VLRALAAWTLLFAVLLAPWLPHAATALPDVGNRCDARLVVWILAWVAHALAAAPAAVFQANIEHPAPAQLTGSEHLFSAQLLFAPLFWTTGSAVLATNLTVALSYPLAALAMQRLLRAVGMAGPVAVAGALLFALGPRRVPFDVHAVQYPNLFFPLVALALVRLRAAPSLWTAGGLALAVGLGALGSYYLAAMVGAVAAVWGAAELFRRAPRRLRYAALALGAAAGVALVVRVCLDPYFVRGTGAAAVEPFPRFLPLREQLWLVGVRLWLVRRDQVLGALGLLGVVAGLLGVPPARRVVLPAVVLLVGASVLSHGVPRVLAAALDATPFRFLRAVWRLDVLGGFGAALLVAAGLDALARRLPRALAVASAAALAVLVLVGSGRALAPAAADPVRAVARRAIYVEVGRVVRAGGGGALLELPLFGRPEPGLAGLQNCHEADAMIGSTYHWLRLVNGYTGYHPPHRLLFLQLVNGLPDARALDDLVDVTHVRWILLRPVEDWDAPPTRAAFLARVPADRATAVADLPGGWRLLRLERAPAHPGWFAAVAAGTAGDRTVLGTPLAPLAPRDAVGVVRIVAGPPTARAGGWLPLVVGVTNAGSATWPVAAPPTEALQINLGWGIEARRHATVAVRATWRAADGAGADVPPPEELRLVRDVPPGETLTQPVALRAPARPGRYELELGLAQDDVGPFDAAASPPARAAVAVDADG